MSNRRIMAVWPTVRKKETPMLTREENELVTRVGPGAPMGDVLRRYWVPAFLSREVPRPDCPPARGPITGEEPGRFPGREGPGRPPTQVCPPRPPPLWFARQ